MIFYVANFCCGSCLVVVYSSRHLSCEASQNLVHLSPTLAVEELQSCGIVAAAPVDSAVVLVDNSHYCYAVAVAVAVDIDTVVDTHVVVEVGVAYDFVAVAVGMDTMVGNYYDVVGHLSFVLRSSLHFVS